MKDIRLVGLTNVVCQVGIVQQAVRWTWLIITAHAQLRLARPLAGDLRLPWERPAPPGRLTPPGSAAGLGTSARPCPAWPVHPNPASPGPAARQARRTAIPHPATTWAKGEEGPQPQGTARTRRLNGKLRSWPETGRQALAAMRRDRYHFFPLALPELAEAAAECLSLLGRGPLLDLAVDQVELMLSVRSPGDFSRVALIVGDARMWGRCAG